MACSALRRVTCILAVLALVVTASGCGVIDYFFVPKPEETALDIFQAGQEAMDREDWSGAVKQFSNLRDRFPFSPYTVQAELLLADAYFSGRSYAEAIVAYKDYESLHPRDERIPYVLYRIGLANYRSMKAIDKPQSHASEAVEYFQRLLQSFPDSEYVPQAREHLFKARRQLAEHELFVADFYWRANRYGSAWQRYAFVAENFQDVPDAASYAEKRAQESFLERQLETAEKARRDKHGSWRKWFRWL